MSDEHTKQWVVQAHKYLKYIFQSILTHVDPQLPYQLERPIPQLLPQISRIPDSARHGNFTLMYWNDLHPQEHKYRID